jgi:hypothetical protein
MSGITHAEEVELFFGLLPVIDRGKSRQYACSIFSIILGWFLSVGSSEVWDSANRNIRLNRSR